MKRRGPLLVLLLLALAPLLPGLLEGRVLFRRDVHLMWYTQVEALVDAVGHGSWPMWNRYLSFGQPLWADANVQPLYPTTLLHFVVRPWHWYSGYALLHLWLAGLGTALLLRRLGASPRAALVGGAILVGTGPVLSLVEAWNQLAGAAWMPWAAASALAAVRRPEARRTVAWSLALAAPVLAGSPEGLLMGLALSAFCVAARVDLARPGAARRVAATTALALLLAGALSAGQWLPSLEAAGRSARGALSREARGYWAVQPRGLLQAVVPVPFAELPLRAEVRQQLFGGRDAFLSSLYLGLPALALVLAPWCPRSRRRRLVLGTLLLGALLFALGTRTPLFGLTSLVPGLRALRYPAKAMALAACCWALLAGLGFDDLRRRVARAPRFTATGAALLGLAAVLAALLAVRLSAGVPPVVASLLTEATPAAAAPLARAALLLAGTTAAMAVALVWARRGAPLAMLALAVVPIVDLQLAHRTLLAMAPVALYTHPPALLASIDRERRVLAYDYQEPGASLRHLGRANPYVPVRGPAGWPLAAVQALGLREALFPPSGGGWRLLGSFDRDVSGFGSDRIRALGDLLHAAEDTPETYVRLLRLGAVGSVVSLHPMEGLEPVASWPGVFAGPVRVYRVPGAVPRSYLARGLHVEHPEEGVLAPHFQVLNEVLLAGPPEPPGGPPANGGAAGTSRVTRESGDALELEVVAREAAWLVVVDAYDPHWRARLDGQPAEIVLANGAFRAVHVPAGRHVVDMAYRPWPVFAGLALSLGGGLAALAMCWRTAGQGRKNSPSRMGSS